MHRSSKVFLIIAFICILTVSAVAQTVDRSVEITAPANYRPIDLENSPELQTILVSAVGEMVNSYPPRGFKMDDISATLIDLSNPGELKWANLTGEKKIYPASVVKMFYMAALHQQLQDGKIKLSTELSRGLKDMIVDSSNEATQYILDVLTGTSSGAEKPKPEFDKWQHKRNRVNRYFLAMDYQNINVNQKTFCEDAYGIEQQSRAYKGQNRNMLTTNATARLLAEIALGRAVSTERSREMMELMKRDPFVESKDPDNQATGFAGKAFIDRKMTGAKLWSKAGWTSKSRHDAAYIETTDGLKFVLVIFTENHATDRQPIPVIAGKIIERMGKKE